MGTGEAADLVEEGTEDTKLSPYLSLLDTQKINLGLRRAIQSRR